MRYPHNHSSKCHRRCKVILCFHAHGHASKIVIVSEPPSSGRRSSSCFRHEKPRSHHKFISRSPASIFTMVTICSTPALPRVVACNVSTPTKRREHGRSPRRGGDRPRRSSATGRRREKSSRNDRYRLSSPLHIRSQVRRSRNAAPRLLGITIAK